MFESIISGCPSKGRARPLAILPKDPETIVTNSMEELVTMLDSPKTKAYSLGISNALISMVTCGCQWKSIRFMLEAADIRFKEEIVHES